MLKLTGVELDLFPPDQAHMHTSFNNARRGGFTTCVKRYAKATHKYLKDYDPTKPSVFIMAFDINGSTPLHNWKPYPNPIMSGWTGRILMSGKSF